MDRVVKLGRRNLIVAGRQHRADIVDDVRIARAAAEDRRHVGRRRARRAQCLLCGGQRDTGRRCRAPPLGCREQIAGRRQRYRRERTVRPPDNTSRAAGQSASPGPKTPIPSTAHAITAAYDRASEDHAAIAAAEAERIRQRDVDVRAPRCRAAPCSGNRDRDCSRVQRAGSKPCSSASSATIDSTMPAAPSRWPNQPLVELLAVRSEHLRPPRGLRRDRWSGSRCRAG